MYFHVSNICNWSVGHDCMGASLRSPQKCNNFSNVFPSLFFNSVECFLDKNIDKKKTIRIFYIIIMFASFYEN